MVQVEAFAIETGLATIYPDQEQETVVSYLLSLKHISRNEVTHIQLIRDFIYKQKRQGNIGLTIETLCLVIDTASYSVRRYESCVDFEINNLASIVYLHNRLGGGFTSLVPEQAQGLLNRLCIGTYIDGLTYYDEFALFVKNTCARITTELSARALYMLDIMIVPGLEIGIKYQFMAAPNTTYLMGWEWRYYRAITALTKHCLQTKVSIDTVWNTFKENGQTIWGIALVESDREHIERMLLFVFAKQRLLFDYLLSCTPTRLQEICKFPDIARMLTSTAGKLPVTRAQKLSIACKWTSPLLLDLLNIDVDMIGAAECASSLVIPKQVSSQTVSIEI
ncbi:Hypothetical protein MVR_LOCUS271 [uncultured virus]|nr:Hypothetical protein MVR_LOCUS271 [uncultured virus]